MNEKLNFLIRRPTLLLDEAKARANIRGMVEKARRSGVSFRPHFKTHQSALIGEWFREEDITAATVSSLEMAAYFIENGWVDITVAFPVNVREMALINQLASQATLHLLVATPEMVPILAQQLTEKVYIWLEIDAGYGRSGFVWQAVAQIEETARVVEQQDKMMLAGLLTHAGNTYRARSVDKITAIHHETVSRMQYVQAALAKAGIRVALSVGDTPACSVLDSFEGIDEIRPGNFVFYDLMQAQIGACTFDEIAVAVACPVVSVSASAQQIVVYGGAVHLSKEQLTTDGGWATYGRVAHLGENGWTAAPEESYVKALSQEHGVIHASPQLCEQTRVGDLLLILPVHACLTANLLKQYITLDGELIQMAPIH